MIATEVYTTYCKGKAEWYRLTEVKTIKKKYSISASIDKVWKALVDPDEIENWGGGPATMNDRPGSLFKLWGGDIFGKNVDVQRFKLLVQQWYGGEWDMPSIATFSLQKQGENKTVVELVHEDVPDREAKDIDKGWDEYYMGPLKLYVENKK